MLTRLLRESDTLCLHLVMSHPPRCDVVDQISNGLPSHWQRSRSSPKISLRGIARLNDSIQLGPPFAASPCGDCHLAMFGVSMCSRDRTNVERMTHETATIFGNELLPRQQRQPSPFGAQDQYHPLWSDSSPNIKCMQDDFEAILH